jgi:integrase
MHLTDTLCRRQQPPQTGYQVLYDDEVPGLGLRITAGGARSFILNYRRKSDGRERRKTIGSFPAWTTALARAEAKRLRRDIDLGADPLAEVERSRAEPTLADIIERDLIEITSVRPSTLRTWRNQIQADILPALGRMKINAITTEDIANLHRKISARGALICANRVVATLSAFMGRAIERGLREEPNPVSGFIKRRGMNKEHPRERYLSPSEIERLATALDGETDRQAANAIKLLWLTGSRRGETLAARWSDFDLVEGRWLKPGHTTKNATDHGVPLSAAALALLHGMYQQCDQSSPYVFPAVNINGELTHRTRVDRSWDRIRATAEIKNLRLHDLRHAFATAVHDAGAPLAVVGRLLGHRNLRSTQRYSHATERGLRVAVEYAAEAIGNVVPLPSRGKRQAR